MCRGNASAATTQSSSHSRVRRVDDQDRNDGSDRIPTSGHLGRQWTVASTGAVRSRGPILPRGGEQRRNVRSWPGRAEVKLRLVAGNLPLAGAADRIFELLAKDGLWPRPRVGASSVQRTLASRSLERPLAWRLVGSGSTGCGHSPQARAVRVGAQAHGRSSLLDGTARQTCRAPVLGRIWSDLPMRFRSGR